MCGIVGLFNFGGPPRDEREILCRMRDAMVHRGPDDAGVYVSPDRAVALGHRRLSIVDVSSAGHQPMSNEDGQVWITFNGEIYNHVELRRRLGRHAFRSRTDTEAIIHLYEELGDACLSELDGMFAFAIWDAARRRMLLARDRLGEKPLYYTQSEGRLLFASEIKALLAYPGLHRDIDPEALDLFLTFSNVPAPRTLFAGIYKLPAAHRLVCDARGRIAVERYWSPIDATWPTDTGDDEAASRVRELVGAAVRDRLMSDVPVGCFLSGGVDSSTNVAILSRLVARPLRTFSIGFEGFGPAENFHDLPYARQVAERFGCDHREIVVTADACKRHLPELVVQQDEPLGDPACLPMHFAAQAAKADGIKVVLVGEGSDEVFGGYEDMRRIVSLSRHLFEAITRLPAAARWGLHRLSRLLRLPAGRTDVLRRAAAGEPLYWGLDVAFWETEKEALLAPAARAAAPPGGAALIQRYRDELRARQPGADPLQEISYIELSNRLPELLLMRVDKLSMAHSVEARAPFLDHRLVAYALSLPQRLKIHGRATKSVLKRAVAPLLPPAITARKKQGFRVPLPAWLAGDLAPWAEHHIRSSPLRRRGLFNTAEVDRMWAAHRAGARDHSFDLWCLLNLSAWYEQWIERRGAA